MDEIKIKEEEVAAAITELLRAAALVSAPSGKDEAAFRQQLTAFVNSLPPESALQLAKAYKQVASTASERGSGLTSAGLKPADMILGAFFTAAQTGKTEVSVGDALGAALPPQQDNLLKDKVEV